MPKVLHVSENIQGGVATSLSTLVSEHLKHPEWSDVRVLASDRHSPYLIDVPNELIDKYRHEGRNIRAFRSLAAAIRRSVETFQPDIVYLHSSFPGAIGRVVLRTMHSWKRPARPCIVYNPRGWSFHMERPAPIKFAYRTVEFLLAGFCDRIICISKNELRGARAAGISEEKSRLVYNGLPDNSPPPEPVQIPSEFQAAINSEDPVLLFLGRYDEQKGIDLLLDAMRILSGSPLKLLCAGGKVTGGKELRFPPNCADLGWVTPGQVTFLLEKCDALVIPSRWEGFGLVAAEAARAGRAVFCSDRGGLPEIVEDGKTGVVIKDLSPRGIAETLKQSQGRNLPLYGAAAKKRFLEVFRAGRMFAETVSVYNEAMQITRRC